MWIISALFLGGIYFMMKKLIALALSLMLAVTMMAVCVSADEGEPDYTDMILMQYYDSYGENANISLQKDSFGGLTAIGLKPADSESGEGAWFEYEVEIPFNCSKIDFVISYAASSERHMEFTFNGETRKVTCPATGDWGSFLAVTETFESVEKGEYTIRVAAPEDFDNDTIKTPNIDYIDVNMYLAEGETLPDELTTPVTDAPTEAPETNAQTADNTPSTSAPNNGGNTPGTTAENEGDGKGGCGSVMGASALIVALTAAFGCAVIKRR